VLLELGAHERAAPALTRAAELQERLFGAHSAQRRNAIELLASSLSALGRLPEAAGVQRQVVGAVRSLEGDESRALGDALNELALLLQQLGGEKEAREAEAQLRRALVIYQAVYGPGHQCVTWPNLPCVNTAPWCGDA
jgi:hypothetical protein